MRADPDLRRRVNVARSTVPAITHVDYSARVQTVDEKRHGRFYRLLTAFHKLTGCPMLVNTSFNVRGEPIVCTPEQALRCFQATAMDALVLEDVVLARADLAASPPDKARHDIGRISRLGLLEVSRQRLRPAATASSYTACPMCEGHGAIRTTESAALVVLRKIHHRLAVA